MTDNKNENLTDKAILFPLTVFFDGGTGLIRDRLEGQGPMLDGVPVMLNITDKYILYSIPPKRQFD